MRPAHMSVHGAPPIEAVLLDIGGVFVIPDLDVVADEFARHCIEVDPDAFLRAHYGGMAALDAVTPMPGAWTAGYVEGVLDSLGLIDAGREPLGTVLRDARRFGDDEF